MKASPIAIARASRLGRLHRPRFPRCSAEDDGAVVRALDAPGRIGSVTDHSNEGHPL